jgi:dipeptidyl aminopeptidase/acylaminoacyl peptidase
VPDVAATTTTAGPPALVAWSSGRNVLVAGPDGAGQRVVARLRQASILSSLTLSAGGRRLALVTGSFGADGSGGVRVADLTAGGPLRTLAREGRHAVVRWSPDGRRALLVGDTIRLCDVAAQTPCRSVAQGVQDEFGATWAPDGTRFAYIGSGAGRSPRNDREEPANVVLNDGSGRERILERERRAGLRKSQPWSPVWTLRGLAWTTLSLLYSADSEDLAFTRSSTRLLGADGRIRTVSATSRPRRAFLPFALTSDSPSGDLIGVRTTFRSSGTGFALDGELLRLTLSGATPRWGLTLPGDLGDRGGVRDVYLGMLADGRAAVAHIPVEAEVPPPADARSASARAAVPETTTLHLVGPGGALGPALASGDAVAVATPYPAAIDPFF